MDNRFLAAFVAWVNARESRLNGQIYPELSEPATTTPFAVYTEIYRGRVKNLQTVTGQAIVVMQLDIWSQDHALGSDIAGNICGVGNMSATKDARGLDQFQGYWTWPTDTTKNVWVQYAECIRFRAQDAAPILGTETPWFNFSADYRIYYEECY